MENEYQNIFSKKKYEVIRVLEKRDEVIYMEVK